MNCPKCNAVIPDGSDTCNNCGYTLSSNDKTNDTPVEYDEAMHEALDDAVEQDIPDSMDEIIGDTINEAVDDEEIKEEDYNKFQSEVAAQAVNDEASAKKAKNTKTMDPTKKKLITIISIASVAVLAIIIIFISIIVNIFSSGSNQANSGTNMAVSGNTVYFANPLDGNKLYKLDMNKDEPEKICDDSVKYISVAGNTIYYTLPRNDEKLCSISIDGKNSNKEITEHPARYVTYAGGYVYYSNPGENNQIYRITSSGVVETIPNALGTDIQVANGYLYYINNGALTSMDLSNGETVEYATDVTKFDTDGQNLSFISNGTISFYKNVTKNGTNEGYSTKVTTASDLEIVKEGHEFAYLDPDGIVKHINISSDSTTDLSIESYDELLYTGKKYLFIDIDGQRFAISSGSGEAKEVHLPAGEQYGDLPIPMGNQVNEGYGTADQNYLYYLDYQAQSIIKESKTNPDDSEILAEVPASNLTVSEGWLYYADFSVGGMLYRMRTDGTEATRISVDSVANMIVYGDWIYYITYNHEIGEYYIRRTTRDGQTTSTLKTGAIANMTIADGWIYYTSVDQEQDSISLCRMYTNGQYDSVLIEHVGQPVAAYGDRIYYVEGDRGYLKSCDLSGQDIQDIGEKSVQSFTIENDTIYFSELNNNNPLYKMNLDGSEETLLSETPSFGISACGDTLIFASFDEASQTYFICAIKTDGTGERKIG